MAWRYHGHAKVNARNPNAYAICDRCGLRYNLEGDNGLRFQYEWRGNQLLNIWIRVCKRCLDVPQQQLRPKAVPPDPVPKWQPRPDNFALANAGGVPIGGTVTVPNLLTNDEGDLLASDRDGTLLVAD